MDNLDSHKADPHKANGSKRPLPADWMAQRNAAATLARTSPKINAKFLHGLLKTLDIDKRTLGALLKISPGIMSKYLSANICPDYVLDRANELLAARGLAPIGTPPKIKKPKPTDVKALRPPKGSGPQPQVPSSFLDGIEDKLGIRNRELLALLGVATGVYFTWKKKGTCPIWVRAAVSGLLAEKGINDGTLQEAPLPRRKLGSGRKPGSKNKTENALVPAFASIEQPRIDSGVVVLMVAVPHDKLAIASALLASFGFPIKQGS